MGFNKKKRLPRKNRKTKSILVFDESARKEYLTGFKKRKDVRRKKAQEQVEKMIKEDRKLLKQKTKEFEQVKTRYQQPAIDLEELVDKHVTELPEHTVTVTDISEIDLAGHAGTRLGQNKFAPLSTEDDEVDEDDVDDDSEGEKAVPGISVHKHDKAIKTIKNKIFKTSKHLKKKKSKQGKTKRLLSKKAKHRKKLSAN
ncbi:nucleolar protein 12-like isoform X2 [Dreissena polymorpha]|uniref:Nucleolar protein 12 n=1 Tax=Dreissena polymorpha TaxID=45954 RepID=A0A9D4M217_DREPO|nr:nucleolar protein 12-like isoform X2 [Dreissena polymorpha]KAH3867777.1 hypothetical protein DPMN_030914 [Dreissena polymorpha]